MSSRVADFSSSPVCGHSFLAYEGESDFLGEGVRFLAEGVENDDRLVYVSGQSEGQMLAGLGALRSSDQLMAAGTLTLLSYANADRVVVPEEQLAYFSAATEQAVADGHRGLRVLAELTGLAGDVRRRRSLLRYEHLATRYMAAHPMSALCAVDRTALGEASVAEVEAVHSQVAGPGGLSGFRLLPGDDGLELTGVVEAWEADRLSEVLHSITGGTDDVRLRLQRLSFISGRGLKALARYGTDLAAQGGHLTVIGARPVLTRAWTVLGLDLTGSA